MAVTSLEFLRSEINGVEFFTVIATGESAVSVSGLSKMSGVPKQTISRWFSDLSHESTPEWLKGLQGMPLDLSHELSDAPTPNQRLWSRHLSPVKDIEIFLRGTPQCFPLRRFIVRNATRPTVFQRFYCSTKPLSYRIGQATHLNSRAFHPHPKSNYGVGIPTVLSNA